MRSHPRSIAPCVGARTRPALRLPRGARRAGPAAASRPERAGLPHPPVRLPHPHRLLRRAGLARHPLRGGLARGLRRDRHHRPHRVPAAPQGPPDEPRAVVGDRRAARREARGDRDPRLRDHAEDASGAPERDLPDRPSARWRRPSGGMRCGPPARRGRSSSGTTPGGADSRRTASPAGTRSTRRSSRAASSTASRSSTTGSTTPRPTRGRSRRASRSSPTPTSTTR